MNLNDIKQLVRQLKARYEAMQIDAPFREVVQLAYSKPALHRLEIIFSENLEKDKLTEALQNDLEKNWDLVHNTALGYTALPSDELTHLFCDIAQHIADERSLNPIEVLMPGVAYESIREGYPDLDKTQDIKYVLQTHVLGHDGKYLLPVKLLSELDLSPTPTLMGNPYFDYAQHAADSTHVNSKEYERLVAHSPLTQAVFDAKHKYDLLTNDTSTLLGQLKQLCQQLGSNMAGALGEETNAGSGAYPAIINFMEYYNKLSQAEKNNIPNSLKREIDLLLALVTDKTQNINATENIETCIATRRSQLILTMSGRDEVLNQISLSGAKKASLITEASEQFDSAQQALATALKGNYQLGHDQLDIRACP